MEIQGYSLLLYEVGEMWYLSDDWTYRTAAYFCDHVINLRFDFSEGRKVSLVVKSHVCVRMEQEALVATAKKLFFLVQRKKNWAG